MNKALFFRLLLGISLAFNIAILVTVLRHEPHDDHAWQNMPDEVIHRLTKNLSPQDSAIVHQVFDARQGDFDRMRVKMQSDLAAVDAAMRADPFDGDALRHAMDDVHHDRTAGGSLIEDCILKSASTISSDGRTKLLPPQPSSASRR